jgi:thioredoxin 1
MPVGAVSGEAFEREVLESEKPVIVDFWAPWCGPCLAVTPLLEQIASERRDELKVVKVNVDEEPELAVRFGIASIPTILFFNEGNPVAGTMGAKRKRDLETALGLHPVEQPSGDNAPGGFRGLISRLGRVDS